MDVWTIKKLLEWISGYFEQNNVDAPRLSAELLLCHVLKLERIQLYTLYDKIVAADDLATLRALVKRAAEHEPVAYLVGRCEFYSLPLTVTADCLIPRPETEQLVERSVDFLRSRPQPQQVLDLCTGSGCIAAAIAKNVPQAQIIAADISDAALSVASANIEKLALTEQVQLLSGDLFGPLTDATAAFDLIVSNPPYISDAEFDVLDKNVRAYEPQLALKAGPEGLDVYKRIIAQVDCFLKPDGALMMEIGCQQGPTVRQLLIDSNHFADTIVEKDFASHDRIAIALKSSSQ